VLGHEIGHVIARHHEERITRQMGAQTGLGILGVLVGAKYGSGAADTANQLGGMTLQTAFLLPGSREQESEADVVGQRLMAQAGFDPAQAVNLWQNMMAAGGSRPPQWLSTHPDPAARIRKMQQDAPALAPIYQQARASGHTPRCG
jgi:predicted Zn-dependent protease